MIPLATIPISAVAPVGTPQIVPLTIDVGIYDRLVIANKTLASLDIQAGVAYLRIQPNTVDVMTIESPNLLVTIAVAGGLSNPQQLEMQAVAKGEELTESYPSVLTSGALSTAPSASPIDAPYTLMRSVVINASPGSISTGTVPVGTQHLLITFRGLAGALPTGVAVTGLSGRVYLQTPAGVAVEPAILVPLIAGAGGNAMDSNFTVSWQTATITEEMAVGALALSMNPQAYAPPTGALRAPQSGPSNSNKAGLVNPTVGGGVWTSVGAGFGLPYVLTKGLNDVLYGFLFGFINGAGGVGLMGMRLIGRTSLFSHTIVQRVLGVSDEAGGEIFFPWPWKLESQAWGYLEGENIDVEYIAGFGGGIVWMTLVTGPS